MQIRGTPYEVDQAQAEKVKDLGKSVVEMRNVGRLSPEVLSKLRSYFRIKNIYHSNAIEGNLLNVGETRLVVEQGLTITGKPLKDQAEAKNLSAALDFLEELARKTDRPITEADVRQLHFLVLKGISDDEAGHYRSVEVEISGSRFRPPSAPAVSAQMGEFGKWLREASIPQTLFSSSDAVLAACAAHTWFVTIHPFIDGNGRVARLLMNVMLMRYGFPISIVTKEDRLRYYDALETSQSSDLTSFVSLVVENVEESLEEYQAAAEEQRENIEWAKSLASKFEQREVKAASNQYEVWKNAMELLKSQFRQSVDLISSSAKFGDISLSDFGTLEFEKYASLKNRGSAKKTWFFRLDFRSGTQVVRYLFFFGFPSYSVRALADVTLHVSREEPPGSFNYQRLDAIVGSNVPTIFEIGYDAPKENFVTRGTQDTIRVEKVDALCRRFIGDVIDKHF